MKEKRFILLPLALVYGCCVSIHRMMYKIGILTKTAFQLPVISVGNLSVGGTGKSPHVEFMHQLLTSDYSTAIVSRGYGRKSKGVREVHLDALAIEVGDEPLQFKLKYPKTTVIVAERRVLGVQKALTIAPTTNCILLDDAFQHWAIAPTVQVMLTTFDQPFFDNWVLPAGNLREFRRGYQRADFIIVTKCPASITEAQRASYIRAIQPLKHQKVFFSYFSYQTLYNLVDVKQTQTLIDLKKEKVLVVTGIADTTYLEQFMDRQEVAANYLRFPDHHHFSLTDLEHIKAQAAGRWIVITQKDATKLLHYGSYIQQNNLSVYVLPIEVTIAFDEKEALKQHLLRLINAKKG
ncbi:tetraacyldisaccharide 4'-kinase [Aureispira anguillae]|uniref:Tetraacyldisaccharide 4'-kinase n=1 Tax=Aureispira anguillae TaxID=2864201 RepID=A0A915YI38_9BACT|nr:tetraacyldisaccharide 4'-kinase [Aureispira anguillae]BDS13607.1 tetraacyldisaccharide 4'-kinase [Aureispira anguillae]